MKLIVQWRGDLQKFTGTFPDGCGGVINADLGTGADELWFKIGAFAMHWGRGTAFDEVDIVRPTGDAPEEPKVAILDNGVLAVAQPKKPAKTKPAKVDLQTTGGIVTAVVPRETGSDPQV